MNIYCEHCDEPWDHTHILDAIPGIRDGAVTDQQLEHGVLDTDGQWWKFWFLYRDQMYEANYRITQCPSCEPDIGVPSCKHCYGHGRIFISKATHAYDLRCRHWFYGFSPNIHSHPTGPFRPVPSFQHDFEGTIYQGWAHCPECFASKKEYFEATKQAGWQEPYTEEQ